MRGMRARWPQMGPPLIAQHCAAALPFAREDKDCQAHHCHPVLFTDESRLTRSTCDRRDSTQLDLKSTLKQYKVLYIK